jgi:hypothetical protein
MTTQINVKLTPDYALSADSNNFVILARTVVDPTKAPGYDATKGGSTELREVWKTIAYYSLTSAGLTSALDYVRIRTVASSGVTDLGELVALIQAETEHIVDAINSGVKLPSVSVVVAS